MSPRAGLDTQTLVLAAAEIADQSGFEQVTLSSLAAKLGVRPPSLYNHIGGLAELRTLVALYGLNELRQTIVAATEGVSGEAAIHAMGKAYVSFARRRPGLYDITLRAPEHGDSALETASVDILQRITGLLAEYRLGTEGELHAVRGLRSLLHGFAVLESKGAFGMPLDTGDSFTRLLNSFLAGIRCMRDDSAIDNGAGQQMHQ